MSYDYNYLRFGNQTDLSFPDISYYIFEENKSTRGISDREFRWKEVYLDVPYLYRETTTYGSFESHSFISGITTPQRVSPPTGYSGWTVTGDSAYHIGESGTYFSEYGAWAYPISSNTAILLNATGTEVTVTQEIDISDMPLERQYQVYLLARSLSGIGKINPYVSIRDSTYSVYYNPYISGWSENVPTGYYTVSNTGYTEILNTFYTRQGEIASSVEIIPEDYLLIISQASGETVPVIVDEIHIDEILIRNPYVDYFIPTGYLLQITPDIGWHNLKDMFSSSGNPYLKTFGPYTLENLGLQDNLDGSVSVTLTENQFTENLYQGYKRYLWQAIAISPDGTLGKDGVPQRFSYIGRILDNEFSVEKQDYEPFSILHTVEGKKPKNSTVIVDGQISSNIEYPTETSWKYTLILEEESKRVEFMALDKGGATSSKIYCDFQNVYVNQTTRLLWNTFDEHGLLMDIQRLSGESNYKLKNRIKDISINPGGSLFEGVVNSANRELGLEKISDALTLEILDTNYSIKKNIVADISILANAIRIRSNIDIISETVLCDPVNGYIYLTKYPRKIVEIKTENQTKVSSKDYAIDNSEDDFKNLYIVKLSRENLFGKYVTVVYEYYDSLYFNQYTTLQSIKEALNSLTNASGKTYVSCKLSSLLSGGESSLGLYKGNYLLNRNQTIGIDWSSIYLNRISDRNFRKLYISGDSQLYETQYYSYIKDLQKGLRIFWGNVEMDKDYWDISETVQNSLDHIPTVTDPIIHNYIDRSTGIKPISSSKAWATSYLDQSGSKIINYGMDSKLFHPGIGFNEDIKLGIEIVNTNTGVLYNTHGAIPSIRNNNKQIFFSGQR